MKKTVFLMSVFLLSTTLILWADNTEAGRIMDKMAEAMNRFAERTEDISSPDEYIAAVTEYAETVETIGKEMFAIIKAHPDWGDDPPADVEQPLNAYMEAAERYVKAEQRIVRYANEHSGHEGVQAAIKRLNKAIYEMYK